MKIPCWFPVLLGTLAPLCEPYKFQYGSASECESAPMVPGYNLGGEGFDIVTMERKAAYVIDTENWDLGNGTCKLYPNPFLKSIKQKVPAAVVDWRPVSACSLSVSSTSYDSVETLVNDSTSSVTNNWKIGLTIPVSPTASVGLGLGGSHSKTAKFAVQKSKADHYNFYRHSIYCSYYQYRMGPAPPMSKSFKIAVNSLPAYTASSKDNYRRIIDTYGTHLITQVYLGGELKAVTSVKTCQASMNGLTESDVSNCLSVEASANVQGKAGFDASTNHCKAKGNKLSHSSSFSQSFSERYTDTIGGSLSSGATLFTQSDPSVYNEWMTSLQTAPDVVKYNLQPLHTILADKHKAKTGIKKEVEAYIMKNALFKKCSEKCAVGQKTSPRDPCACVCSSNKNMRSNCCPTGVGKATLMVYGLYAKNLYGDVFTQTDGSVEVVFEDQVKRTGIIDNNDNPKWGEVFNFGAITINMNTKLKFTVYDCDTYWNSDLLGGCSFDLRQGTVSDSCMFDHGSFFFTYKVVCAPSLGGDQCQEYKPSPVSASVAKNFYTRNGQLGKHLRG